MSGSITEALHSAVSAAMVHTAQAVTDVRTARAALSGLDDISAAFVATGSMVIALERLEETAKSAAGEMRAALRDAMETSGCYAIASDALKLELADAPRTVNVTDRHALALAHPELFSNPEPVPDRKAIGDLLRKGRTIQGASLTNGGQPVLRLTTKKAK